MTNKHRQLYITRLLIGLALVTVGILCMFYMSFVGNNREVWYLWAFAAVVFINAGLLSLCSSVVHKVKSDFIRKQRHKEQQRKYEFE